MNTTVRMSDELFSSQLKLSVMSCDLGESGYATQRIDTKTVLPLVSRIIDLDDQERARTSSLESSTSEVKLQELSVNDDDLDELLTHNPDDSSLDNVNEAEVKQRPRQTNHVAHKMSRHKRSTIRQIFIDRNNKKQNGPITKDYNLYKPATEKNVRSPEIERCDINETCKKDIVSTVIEATKPLLKVQQSILADVRSAVESLNTRSATSECRRLRHLEDDSRRTKHRLNAANDRRIAQTEFLASLALTEKNGPRLASVPQPPPPPTHSHHPYHNSDIENILSHNFNNNYGHRENSEVNAKDFIEKNDMNSNSNTKKPNILHPSIIATELISEEDSVYPLNSYLTQSRDSYPCLQDVKSENVLTNYNYGRSAGILKYLNEIEENRKIFEENLSTQQRNYTLSLQNSDNTIINKIKKSVDKRCIDIKETIENERVKKDGNKKLFDTHDSQFNKEKKKKSNYYSIVQCFTDSLKQDPLKTDFTSMRRNIVQKKNKIAANQERNQMNSSNKFKNSSESALRKKTNPSQIPLAKNNQNKSNSLNSNSRKSKTDILSSTINNSSISCKFKSTDDISKIEKLDSYSDDFNEKSSIATTDISEQIKILSRQNPDENINISNTVNSDKNEHKDFAAEERIKSCIEKLILTKLTSEIREAVAVDRSVTPHRILPSRGLFTLPSTGIPNVTSVPDPALVTPQKSNNRNSFVSNGDQIAKLIADSIANNIQKELHQCKQAKSRLHQKPELNSDQDDPEYSDQFSSYSEQSKSELQDNIIKVIQTPQLTPIKQRTESVALKTSSLKCNWTVADDNDTTLQDSARSLRSRHDVATPTLSPVHPQHAVNYDLDSLIVDDQVTQRLPIAGEGVVSADAAPTRHQLPGYNQSSHRLPASPDYQRYRDLATTTHHLATTAPHHSTANTHATAHSNSANRGVGHVTMQADSRIHQSHLDVVGASRAPPTAYYPGSGFSNLAASTNIAGANFPASSGVVVLRLADKGEQYDIDDVASISSPPPPLEAGSEGLLPPPSDLKEDIGEGSQANLDPSDLTSIGSSTPESVSGGCATNKSSSLVRESEQGVYSISEDDTSHSVESSSTMNSVSMTSEWISEGQWLISCQSNGEIKVPDCLHLQPVKYENGDTDIEASILNELSEGEFRAQPLNASTPAGKLAKSNSQRFNNVPMYKDKRKSKTAHSIEGKKPSNSPASKYKVKSAPVTNAPVSLRNNAATNKNAKIRGPHSNVNKDGARKVNGSSVGNKTTSPLTRSTSKTSANGNRKLHSGILTSRSNDDLARVQPRGLPPTSGTGLRSSKEVTRTSGVRLSDERRTIRRSAERQANSVIKEDAGGYATVGGRERGGGERGAGEQGGRERREGMGEREWAERGAGDETNSISVGDSLRLTSATRDVSSTVTSLVEASDVEGSLSRDQLQKSAAFVRKVSTLRHSMEVAQDVINQDVTSGSIGKLLNGVDYFDTTLDSSIDTNRLSLNLSMYSSEML